MKNLQEFDTLEDAQKPVIESKMLAPDIVVSLLTRYDSVLSLQEMAKTNDKAAGFLLALSGSVQEFNLMNSHPIGVEQQQLLAYLVSINAVTQDFATALMATANPEKVYFADVNQERFAACKDAYSLGHEQEYDLAWNRQSRLRVTLHEDLYEPRMVTLFYTDDFFKHKNVGRPTLMHKAKEYLIDLKGVTQTGTLHINFGVKFSADCELV